MSEQNEKLEDQILRMTACNELATVSKECIKAVLEIANSGLSPELKQKSLNVLHIISSNATAFERLSNPIGEAVIGMRSSNTPESSEWNGKRKNALVN